MKKYLYLLSILLISGCSKGVQCNINNVVAPTWICEKSEYSYLGYSNNGNLGEKYKLKESELIAKEKFKEEMKKQYKHINEGMLDYLIKDGMIKTWENVEGSIIYSKLYIDKKTLNSTIEEYNEKIGISSNLEIKKFEKGEK